MPKTLAELIAALVIPKDALLAALVGLKQRNPDLAQAVDLLIGQINSAASPGNIAAKIEEITNELVSLVQTGEGPVTHDPIELT